MVSDTSIGETPYPTQFLGLKPLFRKTRCDNLMGKIGMTPEPYLSPFLSLLLLLRRLLSGNVSLIERLEKGNNLFAVTLVSLVHPSLVAVYQFSQTLIYLIK